MMNKFYTVGYGGLPNVKPLSEALAIHDVEVVVDVRRDPTRAYRGCFTNAHLARHLTPIDYQLFSRLGNGHNALPWKRLPHSEGEFQRLIDLILNANGHIALLCAENPGLREGTVRCHRIDIARELLRGFGAGWSAFDLQIKHEAVNLIDCSLTKIEPYGPFETGRFKCPTCGGDMVYDRKPFGTCGNWICQKKECQDLRWGRKNQELLETPLTKTLEDFL